jgi:general secretion pathway protein M
MMARWSLWWNGRSRRERVMLGVMAVLVAGFLGWILLYRPLVGASRSLADALEVAAQRRASIAVKVELLKAAAAHPPKRREGAIGAIIGESAKQAGLTLDQIDVRGNDRASIAIAATRAPALLAWLSALEVDGISIETVTMAPADTAGFVRVQAVLFRPGASG